MHLKEKQRQQQEEAEEKEEEEERIFSLSELMLDMRNKSCWHTVETEKKC